MPVAKSESMTAMDPRKTKAIVAVLSIIVNDYLNKVNTLLQAVQRQRKLLHFLALIRQRKREKPTTLPRVPVNCCPSVRNLLLDYLNDERLDFERHFRVSRATFRRISSLFSKARMSGWARELELLIFLHWLGMGTSYRAIANTFGIPRSTIHGVVYRYVNNFSNQAALQIQPPQNETKLRNVADGFTELCSSESFGAAAGVIDTCCITTTSGETSVLVQALCDSRGRFLDFSVGYPVSMEPSEVFQSCPLFEKAVYPPQGYFLIAGEGYPCMLEPLTVMPPFRKPLQDEAEASYNAICYRALTVLHDALVQMTGRWRLVFERRMSTVRQRTAKVVAICAMIHNLCIDQGDVWYEPHGEPTLSMSPAGNFAWCVPGDEEMDDEAGLIARCNLAQALLGESASCQVQLEHDYCGPEDESIPEDAEAASLEEIVEQCFMDVESADAGARATGSSSTEQAPAQEAPPEEGMVEEGIMNQDYVVAAELII
ncbi:uncharacterized protein LOC144101733 [Amblyomma americanum]